MADRNRFILVLLALLALLAACSVDLPDIRLRPMGSPDPASDFLGLISAGEPEAVIAAEKILRARGNAADGAATLGLALAVTLPSRAGLAAGGTCLFHEQVGTQEVRFSPETAPGAATPPFVRAIFALQARAGQLPWAQVVAPAEALARFGVATSHALAQDLIEDGAALLEDDQALRVFVIAHHFVAIGNPLIQPELAAELAELRVHGVSGSAADAPRWHTVPPVSTPLGPMVATSAVPAEIAEDPSRRGTSFVVGDADGNVVACALTLGHAFGQGRMSSGFLLASPSATPGAAAIITDPETGEPRFAAAMPRGAGDLQALIQTAQKDGHLLTSGNGVSAWFCPRSIVADGGSCDLLADRARFGYARVVTPLPPS